MTSSSRPAIIKISVAKKDISRINYSRRMYAIIRRYTPNVVEGLSNECYADLTGLRTFFKMTYTEMTEKIVADLKSEIGKSFKVSIATVDAFDKAKNTSKNKKVKSVSTFMEMNKLFSGKAFTAIKNRKSFVIKRKLSVPFLGKVA